VQTVQKFMHDLPYTTPFLRAKAATAFSAS